jgi:2-polyprenyl-3-methyl-5-hydroxy-6-metoxy-1,4-benzoquinol methylase
MSPSREEASTSWITGAAGGQFAMVFKSHFPESTVYITDINDTSLLATWGPIQRHIPFADFDEDETKFDVIFLNDVFEHVNDPLGILKQLAQKLKDGGKIFIDTPKQFWIYPVTKAISKSLYQKVLTGTVSKAHLQIWTKQSFQLVVEKSGCSIDKHKEISEYTMPPEYYLRCMGIRNPFIKALGHLFYRNASWLAKNKIICVLSKRG